MAAKKTGEVIEIPSLVIGNLNVEIIGQTRLVTHRWATKTIIDIVKGHMKEPKPGSTPAKDPVENFVQACYPICGVKPIVHGEFSSDLLEEILFNAGADDSTGGGGVFEGIWAEGRFGFTANGIKAAIVRAGTDVGLNMTDLRRQVRVPGEFIEILSERGARMRCDVTRNASGVIDIRFRPEFFPWRMEVPIQYNKSCRTRNELINLLSRAGFGVGLGENRPAGKNSSGPWGTFKIGRVQELPDETA